MDDVEDERVCKTHLNRHVDIKVGRVGLDCVLDGGPVSLADIVDRSTSVAAVVCAERRLLQEAEETVAPTATTGGLHRGSRVTGEEEGGRLRGSLVR